MKNDTGDMVVISSERQLHKKWSSTHNEGGPSSWKTRPQTSVSASGPPESGEFKSDLLLEAVRGPPHPLHRHLGLVTHLLPHSDFRVVGTGNGLSATQ